MNVPRIPGLDRNDFWSVFQKTPGVLVVSEKQIKQDRASPMDAVMRSAQKAASTVGGGGQKKREPLEVWRVNREDGGSHFALRDGNTTYQMLQSQGWDKFPVVVTKELDEADYTPVGPHERSVKAKAMKMKAETKPSRYLDEVKDQFEEQDPEDEDKGAAEDWVDDVQDDYDELASNESKAAIMVARRAVHAAVGLLAAVDEFYVVNESARRALGARAVTRGPRWKWNVSLSSGVAFASEEEANAALATVAKAERRQWKVVKRNELTALIDAEPRLHPDILKAAAKVLAYAKFLEVVGDGPREAAIIVKSLKKASDSKADSEMTSHLNAALAAAKDLLVSAKQAKQFLLTADEDQQPGEDDKAAAEEAASYLVGAVPGLMAEIEGALEELAAAVSASTTIDSFNKPQKLPKDAEFVTSIRDRDVYAFEEWFYWVDPNTNEVTQVELQKHSPFLQKHLKKGFLSRLGLAASAEGMDDQTRKQVAAQLRAAAEKLTAKQ